MVSFTKISKQYRQADPLRRRVLPAQSGRKGRSGRAQRVRQDHALPHDRRRGSARRRGRLGPEEAHRSATSSRTSRRCRAARSSTRPSPAAAASGRSITSSKSSTTRWRDPARARRHGQDPRALRRGAGGIRASRRLRARSAGARSAARPRLRGRPDRRRRRRRSPAAGRCASPWRACCSGVPTCC